MRQLPNLSYGPVPAQPMGYPAAPYIQQQRIPEDPVELLRKLWRRKWLILGVMLASLICAFIVVRSMTPLYTAVSRVMLGTQEQRYTKIDSVLQGLAVNLETVQSEGFVIQSRGVAEQVVRRLGLEESPEFNPKLRPVPAWSQYLGSVKNFVAGLLQDEEGGAAAEGMQKSIQLTDAERQRIELDLVIDVLLSKVEALQLNRSHVLEIAVEAEHPVLAARIANTFANVYTEQQMIRKVKANENANAWLDQRIADFQSRVETAERKVESYRRQHGLYETRSDNIVAQQLAELNTQVITADAERAAVNSRLGQAKHGLNNPAAISSLPAVLQSPLIQMLRQKQVELNREAAELSSMYGKKHPRMADIRAQLGDLRGQIKGEIAKIVEGLRHEAAAAETRYQSLVKNMEDLKSRMGQRNETAVKLHELEREAEASRNLLRGFLERSREIEAQKDLHQADATVLSDASVPRSASFPPSMLIFAIALIGGSGLGILSVMLMEGLDRTFRVREEIEQATGLPTLALVPASGRGRDAVKSVLQDSTSPVAESLRALYARLVLSPSGEQPSKVVMFASAVPNEGKSQIAASISHLAAIAGLRVVILDCDWQRPTQHRLFRQSPKPGLADLLSGNVTPEEAVYEDPKTGVHVLFAGDTSLMRNELLRFYRLPMLLTTLSKHYDLIVLDTPPVLAGSEVVHLAKRVDSIAFVVRWGRTPRQTAISGINQIIDAGGNVAGTVLSQVDPKRYRAYDYGDMQYMYHRPASVWTR